MPAYPASARLSRDNAALVMIDHQTGLLSSCRDLPPETLTNNIVALAQVGRFFELPVVLTQGGRGGVSAGGPLLRQLAELFPDVPVIDRHFPNAYDDPNFYEAVEATGRKKLVMAGCTFDYCLALPAMHLAADGYEVYAVVDASGNWDALTTHATMHRLSQAGVIVCNWVAVWGELHRDHDVANDAEIMGVMAEAYPALSWVANNWMYAQGAYPEQTLVRDKPAPGDAS
ncbi:MAG: isochorismatase family protein [Geminicoccaceae bacterium]